MNSRQKGKRGELDAVHSIRQHLSLGEEVIRSAQANGKYSADILGIEGLHIEVKRKAYIASEKALKQAERDCGEDIPMALMRQDRGEWFVQVRLADVVEFAKRVNDLGVRQ